jgi:hypothetical protein
MTVKSAILNTLIIATVLALPVQYLIDPSIVNIASVCIVMASSISLLLYIKWGGAFDDQPLSTLALLGFCVTTQLGALFVQSVARTSLIFSLYDPIYTFATLAFYQAIAVAVHVAYRFFTGREPANVGILRGMLGWAGLYRVPACRVLWYMGCLGIISFALSSRVGVLAKIGSAFNFLAWAPFLIPLCMKEVGEGYCDPIRNKTLLVGYTVVVALVGLGLNVRVIIFIGILTIGLLYLIMGMRSDTRVTKSALLKMALLGAVMAALLAPVSDLATAMAIARGSRGKVPPAEMVRRTISIWRQPALIYAYKKEHEVAAQGSLYSVYSEAYIANPMMARFVETKFHDNALHFAGLLTTEDSKERLREVTGDYMWSTVPTPILDWAGIKVDKTELTYSMGDYLVYLARGAALGGHKTGSMFAQGMAIMGPLFPFLYAFMCLVLYGEMDLLTVRTAGRKPQLSVLAMMTLWGFFYRGITSEALSGIFIYVVRDFAQTIVIYAVIFAVGRALLPGWKTTPETSVLPDWHRTV